MLRKSLFAFVLVGCGTDGTEKVTPLVAADTVELHFTRGGAAPLDIRFDVATNQISGYRIETLSDQRLCRHQVTTATAIGDPSGLVAALGTSQLQTLTGDRCQAALANCGGPLDFDNFLNVTVDGGDIYTTEPSMCEELLPASMLESSLQSAFDSVGPVLEQVQQNGSDYVAVGPCFPPG